MRKRCPGPRRSCPRSFVIAGGVFGALLLAQTAKADFSPPPESPYRAADGDRREPTLKDWRDERRDAWEPPNQESTFRFHVGPALLAQPVGPGLFSALDIGQRAVGVRLSALWLRAETERGLSSYAAELWIDFQHSGSLHPVLGAGASFLHGGALGDRDSAAAGVLRGTLEYELPVVDADARLGLSVLGLVPAIGTERTRPWLMGALTVGAGF